MGNKQITHKELLTFSNLTNLEWEFVDLAAIKEGDYDTGQGTMKGMSTQLNDLLDPEVFVRGYEDPETKNDPIYVYGEGEEGKAKLRMNAGIAMEYLEKWQRWQNTKDTDNKEGTDEGSFLGDWEVIYGADNYQVVVDYLYHIYEQTVKQLNQTPALKEELEGDLYPARDKIEDAKKLMANIEVVFEVGNLILNIVTSNGAVQSTEPLTKKQILKIAVKDIGKKIAKEPIKNLIDKTESLPVKLALQIALNVGLRTKVSDEIIQATKNDTNDNFNEEVEVEKFTKVMDKAKIQLTQRLKMFDTEFQVLALKKKDDIVIAYKGQKQNNNKVLPEELDLLQMVYARLKRDNSNARITFTGYEGGANLSFINKLFVDPEDESQATLFYSSIDDLKGYVNFTPDDINKNYEDKRLEIIISGTKDIADETVKSAFIPILIMGLRGIAITTGISALASSFILIAMWGVVEIVEEIFAKEKIDGIYDKFENIGIIEKGEKAGVKGYIRDEFLDNEYIELDALFGKGNKKIKVKKEDVMYLLLNSKIPQSSKDIDSYIVNYEDSYLSLEKGEDSIYEIKKKLVHDRAYVSEVDNRQQTLKEFLKEYDSVYLTKQDKAKIVQGQLFMNLMEIIAKIQKNYLQQKQQIEFIYCDLEAMLDDSANEEDIIKISNKIEELPQKDPKYKVTNEFVFMPFLNQNGDINKDDLKLRDDYLASLFKSMFQKYKEYKKYNRYKSILNIKDGIQVIKYGLEENPIAYSHDFVNDFDKFIVDGLEFLFSDVFKEVNLEVKLNKKFIKMIEDVEVIRSDDTWVGNYETEILFNYHKFLFKKLKNDNEFFKKCYKVTGLEEEKEHFIDSIIILNSEAKSNLEYKYNPKDHIIGGELELYAEDIPVESASREEMPSVGKSEEVEEGKAINEQDESIKTAEIDQSGISDDLFNKVNEELEKGNRNSLARVSANQVINRLC
ncbi:hypothetical protein [Selenihalanaerobacter shriftii]|uniref:Uncharacterized protein n=1 Tax=Selenihalanaerobacter shriftii TaxID=142842 RepID=A0A1T4QHN0_9FIRM|nr:hypothetical protein [Selenihalanaerobacter shriftii]SKA03293.1 hypothetical protein SAMN02745118_02571 [Selenihalanaerobacter shriftii]